MFRKSEAAFTINTAPLNAQTATSAMPGTILTGCSKKINYPVCKEIEYY